MNGVLKKKKLLNNRPFKPPLIVKPIDNISHQDSNNNDNKHQQNNSLNKNNNLIDIKCDGNNLFIYLFIYLFI